MPVPASKLAPFDRIVSPNETLQGTDAIVARLGIQPLRSVTRTDEGTIVKKCAFSVDGLGHLEFDDRHRWCAYSAKTDDHPWSRRDQEKFDVVQAWLRPLGVSYKLIRPADIPLVVRKNAEMLFEGFRGPPEVVSAVARGAIVAALQDATARPFGKVLNDLARSLRLSPESVRKTALAALLDFEVGVDLLEPIMLDRPLPLGAPNEAITLLKSVFVSST